LNLNKNADISIFLRIEGEDISAQLSLEFAFTYRKANTYIKILNYMVNGNIKTIFGMFLITKLLKQHF